MGNIASKRLKRTNGRVGVFTPLIDCYKSLNRTQYGEIRWDLDTLAGAKLYPVGRKSVRSMPIHAVPGAEGGMGTHEIARPKSSILPVTSRVRVFFRKINAMSSFGI